MAPKMKPVWGRLALAFICLFCLAAPAAPLAIGDLVPEISAPDQHGQAFNSTNGYRFLLVATEMACAKSANQKLAEQGTGFLEQQHAAYLLDIHTMPAIARFFAFPKMRKYPQRIILVDTAATLAVFPTRPGRVTVVALTADRHVRTINYWDPDSEPVAGCFQ
jgi:hypothetical protein